MDSSHKRVKVYKLDAEGNWQDQGTGSISTQNTTIKILLEPEYASTLLEFNIVKEDIYHRQQETLIVWTDPDDETSLALSFQEPEGCNDIWDLIVSTQQRLNLASFSLPDPCISNLQETEAIITECSKTLLYKEQLVYFILSSKYLSKLAIVFNDCESIYTDLASSEALNDLYTISSILKSIIFLNDADIYRLILEQEMFPSILGMLECKWYSNADDKEYKKQDHRTFLNTSTYKQVIPLSEEVVTKINLVFRIQYLKDVVLARSLDDGSFSMLNSFACMNQYEIVGSIQSSDDLIKQLFEMYSTHQDMVVGFLKELCSFSRALQPAHRTAFYRYFNANCRSLCHHGIFKMLALSLQSNPSSLQILTSIIEHDGALIRQYTLAQKRLNEPTLFSLIISCFLNDPDTRNQYTELIKLSTTPPLEKDSEIDDFLNLFYDDYMVLLTEPLKAVNGPVISIESAELLYHICQILMFAIKTHTFRSKYYYLGQALTLPLSILLTCKYSYLRVAVVQVFKATIHDEFYLKQLHKYSVFATLAGMVDSKNNCFNSVCLDLFKDVNKRYLIGLEVVGLDLQQGNQLPTAEPEPEVVDLEKEQEREHEYLQQEDDVPQDQPQQLDLMGEYKAERKLVDYNDDDSDDDLPVRKRGAELGDGESDGKRRKSQE